MILRHEVRQRFVRWLSMLVALLMLGTAVSPWVTLGFNITHSLDGFLFVILKNVSPEKGELAAFYPPPNDFFKRHYFVKRITGVPGDQVIREGRTFYIDDGYARVLIGEAKRYSQTGVSLRAAKEGKIPDGHVFVSTPHKDSFDSRYAQLGWIPQRSIFGRAIRVF
jgi:conjugal transfer pilin signal peptidase TrbI